MNNLTANLITNQNTIKANISKNPSATTEQKGIIRIATNEEVTLGENNSTAVTPLTLKNSFSTYTTAEKTFTNKTIDANDNTISDLTVNNLKSGVLQTTIRTLANASDSAIASEKAIANALDDKQSKDTAVTHSENTAVGSTTTPIYIASDGTAIALAYTIAKSVPSDAVFTDTTYSNLSDFTDNLGTSPVHTHSQYLTEHQSLDGYVPTSRTINGKALTSNITLSASDVSALPSNTTIPTVTDTYVATSSDAMSGKAVASALSGYALKSDVASAIIPKGSISTVTNLPTLIADHRGWMYNFSADFTTTSDFVEGTGKEYPAGTNVVVVEYETGVYKYDVFSGFINLDSKQDTLVSGTNIKTINNENILGSGNISISGGSTITFRSWS